MPRRVDDDAAQSADLTPIIGGPDVERGVALETSTGQHKAMTSRP
jgi:hypothetical protein